jgi:tetratricopeptide (TPR) repeat protein
MKKISQIRHFVLWSIMTFLLTPSLFAQKESPVSLQEVVLLIEKSDWPSAIRSLDSYLENQPGDTTALLMRAQSYGEIGEFESALADFKEILDQNPDHQSALLSRGDLFFRMGRFELAIGDWTQYLSLVSEGEKHLAYAKIGGAYLALKMFDEAAGFYDEVIALQEDVPDYFTQKGIALSRVGENTQAIEAFERALSLDPNNSQAQAGLATVLTGSDEELLRQIEETIADSSANSQTYKQRGFFRMNNQDEEGALTDFSKAIEADPEDPENYYYRGVIFSRMKKWQEAEADFSRALGIDPQNPDLILARGQARYRAAELKGALEDFTTLITLDGSHASGFFHRGITLQRLGKISEACVELNKAADLGMIQAEEVLVKVCKN